MVARLIASRIASAVSAAADHADDERLDRGGRAGREREHHVAVDGGVDRVHGARHPGLRHLRDDPAPGLRELGVGHQAHQRRVLERLAARKLGGSIAGARSSSVGRR